MNRIQNFFVIADRTCDFIPFVSFASNIIDLLQKTLVLPFINKDNIKNNHYYTYLKNKTISKCIICSVPFLGNALLTFGVAAIHHQKKSKQKLIEKIKNEGFNHYIANEKWKNDKDIALAAASSQKSSSNFLEFFNDHIKNDPKIVRSAFNTDHFSIQYAGLEIRNNVDFILSLAKLDGSVLEYAGLNPKNSEKVVRAAFDTNILAVQYAGMQLRSRKDFMLEFIEKDAYNFKYASDELKADYEFVLEACQRNGLVLMHLSEAFRLNSKIIKAAVKQNSEAIVFAPMKYQMKYNHANSQKN